MKDNAKISTLTVSTIKKFLNGSILDADFVRKHIKYVIFLFVLGLLVIANRFHAESVFRETENKKKQLEDLRAEKIELQTDLMTRSRRIEVLEKLQEHGSTLSEAEKPPYKVLYNIDK